MERKLQQPLVVGVLATLSCALWGSAYPCIKVGYQLFQITDTGSQVLFAGYRFFAAGIVTFLIGCVWEKRLITIKKTSVPGIMRQGFLQTTLQYLCFYIGLSNTTAGKSAIISAANGFISIIAAHFMLKNDRLTVKNAIGCTLGFSGIILINLSAGNWNEFSFWGEGLLLIGALAYGISTVTLKMIANEETPITITAYQLTFGGGLLLVMGWLLGGRVGSFTFASFALFFYLLLVSTVAFSLWTILLKYNPVGKVAVYGFSVPIFGMLLSALLLKEQVLSLENLAALGCVCGGILIVNMSPSRLRSLIRS